MYVVYNVICILKFEVCGAVAAATLLWRRELETKIIVCHRYNGDIQYIIFFHRKSTPSHKYYLSRPLLLALTRSRSNNCDIVPRSLLGCHCCDDNDVALAAVDSFVLSLTWKLRRNTKRTHGGISNCVFSKRQMLRFIFARKQFDSWWRHHENELHFRFGVVLFFWLLLENCENGEMNS